MRSANEPSEGKASSQTELIDAALKAAENHQPISMLEALYSSGFLSALVIHLRHRYRDFDEDELHTLVGNAVDCFYARASKGQMRIPMMVIGDSDFIVMGVPGT